MASNVSQNIVPSLWSSANDDVLFEFSFNPYLITDTINDSGKVRVTLFVDFDVLPIVGEYIYINSNVYVGTYKILTVTSSAIVTLDLDYTSAITVDTYYCYHLRVPVFSFYKGFLPLEGAEDFSDNLPYTKVIDIKPSVKYSTTTGIPYLPINLKGSVNYIFNIVTNTVANSIDFSMFNAIRLTWDSISTEANSIFDFNLILNSSITNDDLTLNYTSGTKYLIPIDKPLIATSGTNIYSIFELVPYNIAFPIPIGMYPVIHKFINGVKQ